MLIGPGIIKCGAVETELRPTFMTLHDFPKNVGSSFSFLSGPEFLDRPLMTMFDLRVAALDSWFAATAKETSNRFSVAPEADIHRKQPVSFTLT